jgi:hypothetical protein
MLKLSPEKMRKAKIFKTHIDEAVEELGVGYDVTVQGRFDRTPIRLEIVVTSKEEIPSLTSELCKNLVEDNV